MTSHLSKEDQLRDYLLGRLSDFEQKRLERRLLLEDRLFQMGETLAHGPEERAALEGEMQSLEGMSDEEVEEREQAVRAELFDAYTRGELGAEDRQWVRRLSESPSQEREDLAFARALHEETRTSTRENSGATRRPRIWRQAAGIAATLALASLGYLLYHPSATPPPAPQSIEIQLSNSRGSAIESVSIGPVTGKPLELHLHLPPQAIHYQTFEVTIRGREDQILVQQEITVQKAGSLTFKVADHFPTGLYTFQLSGRQNGTTEELGETQIQIVRPQGLRKAG